MELTASPLSGWSNFYVVVGSGAAALIGLQFVVIALIWNVRRVSSGNTLGAFATPTIVHFGAVLMLSCIVIAPWPTLPSAAVALSISGAIGVGYSIVVIRRARLQTDYKPVLEDWLFHAIIPTSAYIVLLVAALAMITIPRISLFAIGSVALALLITGIHNAWDTVTYIVIEEARRQSQPSDQGEPTGPTSG
ncbi:MAG TPA: hypothetical protein VNZ26_24255 [Vicinamibacterales bacterium]|nr:hypothetical protein [Vicinamibacterales bacterium]